MKIMGFALLLVLAGACQVNDQTGEVQPTAETQTATAEAASEAREAGQAVKEGARTKDLGGSLSTVAAADEVLARLAKETTVA